MIDAKENVIAASTDAFLIQQVPREKENTEDVPVRKAGKESKIRPELMALQGDTGP